MLLYSNESTLSIFLSAFLNTNETETFETPPPNDLGVKSTKIRGPSDGVP